MLSQETFRLLRPTAALVASAVLALTLISCAETRPTKASGDIISDTGYKIHWDVELVQSAIEPVAYQITLANSGKIPITFKPSPPDCTLILEPNSYALTPFHRESTTGLTVDENGVVLLQPSQTCTLQLGIDDMQSPLRGSGHECQLSIQPIDTKPIDPKNPYEVRVNPPALKSSVFRISVP